MLQTIVSVEKVLECVHYSITIVSVGTSTRFLLTKVSLEYPWEM